MTLILHQHLNELLHYGLCKIQTHKEDILREWKQMEEDYLNMGKSSQYEMIAAINIFTDVLFNPQLDKEEIIEKINVQWKERIGHHYISQFLLALIESSVHYATKTTNRCTHKDYQAIQYVFTKIKEKLLSKQVDNPFTNDVFLKHLVCSRQIPIDWIAVVEKQGHDYSVEKWFDKAKSLYHQQAELKAETIFELTELLLKYTSHDSESDLLTIPFEDRYLLVCTKANRKVNFSSFMNHALQLLQNGKSTLSITQTEQQWKDPVLMFNDSIIRARNFNEALETITEGFVHYLPFKRSAIFSYSKVDQIGFGLSAKQFDDEAIRNITEDITNFPLMHHSIKLLRIFETSAKYLQPLYIKDAGKEIPQQYVERFKLKSLVITPIVALSNNELLGAAIVDDGEHSSFEISTDVFIALTKFGQSAGEALKKFHHSIEDYNETIHFSPREIEVLELMSEGESTTSAAHKLHLSEYTVRDYITSIMQKMKAKNRTEAVARAIRKGVI